MQWTSCLDVETLTNENEYYMMKLNDLFVTFLLACTGGGRLVCCHFFSLCICQLVIEQLLAKKLKVILITAFSCNTWHKQNHFWSPSWLQKLPLWKHSCHKYNCQLSEIVQYSAGTWFHCYCCTYFCLYNAFLSFDILFYAPVSNNQGHIVFVLSVCLLPTLTFTITFWTVRDRDFIFGMHTQLMMPFQMTQRSMTLWPWIWPLC